MSKTEMPSIRFGGFDNAWEQRKLSELIIEYKETVGSDCTLPILTSSKTEGVILQEEHFGRKQNHDITGYNILPRNYCTYRNRSDGVDFTFNINRCCDKGIISKFYPVFCGNNNDISFISLVLNNSDEVVREIGYTCTGTGQKVLSFWNLQEIKIRVPKYEEQKRIASYIETFDNLITLHQRKYEKLHALKASMLEKMFPKDGADIPEVRFKGFDGAWEKQQLSHYLETSNEKNIQNRYAREDVLSVSGEFGIINQIKHLGRSYSGLVVSNYGVVNYGDIVYTKSPLRDTPYGIIKTNMGNPGIVSALYAVYHPKENVFSPFVQTYFELDHRLNDYLRPIISKGAKNTINVGNDAALLGVVSFPSCEEQKAIHNYFNNLEKLILLTMQELTKLQSLKKALLEKMFV